MGEGRTSNGIQAPQDCVLLEVWHARTLLTGPIMEQKLTKAGETWWRLLPHLFISGDYKEPMGGGLESLASAHRCSWSSGSPRGRGHVQACWLSGRFRAEASSARCLEAAALGPGVRGRPGWLTFVGRWHGDGPGMVQPELLDPQIDVRYRSYRIAVQGEELPVVRPCVPDDLMRIDESWILRLRAAGLLSLCQLVEVGGNAV